MSAATPAPETEPGDRPAHPAPAADGAEGLRLERLLPLACVASAAVLIASEFTTTFEFTPPGAEALAEQSAADRHHYAPVVLAVFAVVALVIAVANGSKPAATAVAACGVIALLIFLLVDVPDAGNVGTLDDARQTFATAEAVPKEGFWLQLIGALGLAISGTALSTLTAEQLAGLRGPKTTRPDPPIPKAPKSETG